MARRIYGMTAEREREGKKVHLAKILSVSERTVRDWLSRIDKDAKEARDRRIFAAWLACDTREEIAERENVAPAVVSEVWSEMADLPKMTKPDQAAASHAKRENVDHKTVGTVLGEMADLPKLPKPDRSRPRCRARLG